MFEARDQMICNLQEAHLMIKAVGTTTHEQLNLFRNASNLIGSCLFVLINEVICNGELCSKSPGV
jgi:hypothetical protein